MERKSKMIRDLQNEVNYISGKFYINQSIDTNSHIDLPQLLEY